MNNDIDMVNHPAHYVSDSGVECINIIRYLPYPLANSSKYVWRYQDKWDPSEDLAKADFYLKDYETFLFKNKTTDFLLHDQTTGAAKIIMETKVRDMFRTHILYLQNNAREETAFFEALYAYLQKARHGVVSYELYSDLDLALTELRALAATPLEENAEAIVEAEALEVGNV